MINKPIKLFYSYSHKDESLRDEFDNHLKILQREGYIEPWHDRRITAGNEWKNEIDTHLKDAEIILLLISSDFIASDYCYDVEMGAALKMHNEGIAEVVPVILRECAWQIAPFSKLQAIPTDGKAITGKEWHNKDEAFTVATKHLKEKIEDLRKKKIKIEEKDSIIDLVIEAKKQPEIILKQIPVIKPYFVGRDQNLKELKEAFETSHFIFIEGGGGIGKTQLVAKFIEEAGIKDKTVWYECHPTSQPDDIIRGAGFEVILKGESKTEREKFSAFKDKIEDFNLDVFLDNYQEVETNENFKSFLGFINDYLSKGHLIVLGRDNIVNPSLQPKRIHLLGMGNDSFQHARRLIEHAYPEQKNITDIVLQNICNTLMGYPLAIDLAMFLLNQNVSPENILEAAVKELKTGDRNIEKISGRLLNEIFTRTDATVDEKNFLRYFSVFRGRIQELAAKAVMPNDVFEKGSRKLLNRNLLNIDGGYYELHPLIREFCYQKLDNIEIESLNRKAAQYYKKQRNENLNPDLEEKIYYHFAQSNDWQEVSETIINRGRDFILKGYLDRLQQMISGIRMYNYSEDIIDILEGDIAQIKGDWERANSLYEHSLKSENEEIKIEANIKKGELLYRRGYLKEAKIIYENAINETKETIFKEWHARAINDLGAIYFSSENYKMALTVLKQSLEIRENIAENCNSNDSLENIAVSLCNIAATNYRLKRYSEASKRHEKSLDIAKKIGSKVNIANNLNGLGLINDALRKSDNSYVFYRQALDIFEEIGDRQSTATQLNNIGMMKKDLGEYKIALDNHEKSLAISTELGDPDGIATSLFNIGTILYEREHDYKKACEYIIKSIAIIRKMGLQNISSRLFHLNNIKQANGLISFKTIVTESIDQLDQNLKKYIEIREILGEPIKSVNKIGRNDPCPCGSGKKYKVCHGKGQ